MDYYIVKYTGPFGFIKPWTAVRDGETFSQQFLTPSIIAGIERKLFPELLSKPYDLYKIKGHRLAYAQMSEQQEQIQPRGWNKLKKTLLRKQAVIKRSILLYPSLFLAFNNKTDAEKAFMQHICLCRNEDVLFPSKIITTNKEQFESDEELFAGYELIFEESESSFLVGYNRFNEGSPMYGWLKVLGNPVKTI